MRVIEIIIDGFKSYAVRTVISGWDESFNSITGLNGSGKSNILDSICFVLGITNMSTVRAQNLQDLIYKRGQAGVTKASVTIVFDNKDKSKSPIGFEEYAQISVTRQIVLGGTSKYLINGHRAQQQTVQNLFQSVQLNINNPNFLIMQGRITKVLNMKPQEILAMIEEAAGTRMFEDRRDKAFKTMAKKEMKVQEITELLRDEIDPKLEKLRQEKRAFLDFQQTQSDVERLTKLVVAYDWVKCQERLQSASKTLEREKEQQLHLKQSGERLEKEIALLREDHKKIMAKREKELQQGGSFQALETDVKTHSHEMVRLTTILELKRAQLSEEAETRTNQQRSIEELETSLKQKEAIHAALKKKHEISREELQSLGAEVEEKEELLQTLQTGVGSREGQESGYQGRLQEAKARASNASTKQEQAKLKISHLEKRIREEEPRARQAEEQNSASLQSLHALKLQAETLESDLKKVGYMPDQEAELRQQESSVMSRIKALQQEAEGLKRKVAGIDFTYSDPHPNFDRSKVKGLVAQLFTLEKNNFKAGTALEICAGGRLYNVVVDSADTGKHLLQKGNLKKRVTIIPLNQIAAFKASADKIATATNLAPGKVDLALSLIGYGEDVNAAMQYVFGSTFICEDATTAKKVTFDRAVRMKSVTLEGDIYDPSGTLSGGSAPQSSGVLVTLQHLNDVMHEIQTHNEELARLQQTMQSKSKQLESAKLIKQQLDLKAHEIKLAEEQIQTNSATTIIVAVKEMKDTVLQLRNDITQYELCHAEAVKDCQNIEADMKDFSTNKDSKLMQLQKALALLKKTLATKSASAKPLQQEVRNAMVDAEQCSSDLAAAREQCAEIEKTIVSQQQEVDTIINAQLLAKKAHDVAQAMLEDERAKLSGFDEELQALEDASSTKSRQITEEGLEQQKLLHRIEKSDKETQNIARMLEALENEHAWIGEDKDLFGQTASPYDFNRQNMAECKASLKNASERFQGMKKKINPKVMNMIDGVEKKEASLKNMMRTVVRDKKKIEETIHSLDEYKQKALEKTWRKVTVDFGDIFNLLLPGNTAKLEPMEGKNVSEGLEVKVCLGKVWKQSLTELSGGQRSLIALSLIMALLQFKPAPMYILDEVDAALDLSHTQNIGRLIKTRFKGSQFIVVSLKDGMFQNANRIFRTRFSDGTSVVQALTPADLR